jgi:HlyD family secretion protein
LTTETKPQLFRQESLDRLASPEQLDQLMQVVTVRQWIPLSVLGALVGCALVWSVVGRVPVHVQGRGALVDPKIALGSGSVTMDVAAPASGIVSAFYVRRGDVVKKGEVIGRLSQPELEAQVALERAHLADIQQDQTSLKPLKARKTVLSKRSVSDEERDIQESLRNALALSPVVQESQRAALAAQRRTVEQRLANARKLAASMNNQLRTRRDLMEKGLIPNSLYLSAERDALSSAEQVTEGEGQLADLNNREAEGRKTFLDSQAQISQLRSRLAAIHVRSNSSTLEEVNSVTTDKNQLVESQRRVARLETQLKNAEELKSGSDGHVLEITVVNGQPVTSGQRLASVSVIEISGSAEVRGLDTVGYFTVGDGMRVKTGMKVQVTPDTVKREEFGGIQGVVTRVSEYPVTRAGVINVVNNQDLAEELTSNARVIEVFAKLTGDPTTTSGYRWSSSLGPQAHLAVGTTGSMQVTLQERPPITYLLPFLKGLFGVD